MKNGFLTILLMMGWSLFPLMAQSPYDAADLSGVWVMATRYHDESSSCDFQLEVRAFAPSQGQIVIYLADYQLSGEPILITLQWREAQQRWEYAFASRGDEPFDLARLDHLWLQLEQTVEGLRMRYQVQETDASYLADFWLRPQNEAAMGWACRYQQPLTKRLSQEGYRILGADLQSLTAAQAFGTDQVGEELRFFANHQTLLPMYETWCACTDFDIVVIGGVYPGSSVQVYGIEWDQDEIRLYETQLTSEASDLTRGDLLYRILPSPAMQ
jgi:hypothetical protein